MTDRPADLAAWSDHHHALTATLAGLAHAVLEAFAVLYAIRFDAPWLRRR